MANECVKCGKKPTAGNNVSHSMRHTKRTFKPNLVSKKMTIGKTTKRVTICTRCLKTETKRAA
ncbi:50S ribosomal protein L28 [Patescibacteria group bacterium]|nr:50S ribosomal protein L28 [Patescibacteria group bacterium]